MNTTRFYVELALGFAGVVLGGVFAWLLWRIWSGPGDDNFVGLLFVAAIPFSVIPAWGLIRAGRNKPWSGLDILWVAGSVLIVVMLGLFAAVFI